MKIIKCTATILTLFILLSMGMMSCSKGNNIEPEHTNGLLIGRLSGGSVEGVISKSQMKQEMVSRKFRIVTTTGAGNFELRDRSIVHSGNDYYLRLKVLVKGGHEVSMTKLELKNNALYLVSPQESFKCTAADSSCSGCVLEKGSDGIWHCYCGSTSGAGCVLAVE